MKKKKKDGFTLTELIAVIAILAIVVLIAIPAYNSIRKRTLETQYNNTVALIETAAAKYASKTGSSIALVQNLIDAGLIETDDGDNVLDPRDNSSLNCYPVEIEYKRGTYKAEFIDEEISSCSVEDAMAKYGDISIIIQNKNTQIGKITGRWVPFDVIAKVQFVNEELANQEGLKYNWVTSGGQTSIEPTIEISTQSIYNGTVNVQVTDSEGNRYFASTTVKLDKEKPLIEDVSVSCDGDCKNGRKVTVKATDKNGSGVAGYYLGTESCTNSSSFESKSTGSYTFKVDVNDINAAKPDENTSATYYACVKDKVGNVSNKKEIKLNIKDTTPPECNWSGEATSSTDWAQSRTITLSCEDSESGCHTDYDSYSRTFNDSNSVIRTQQLSYTIKDNAGNEKKCSKDVNVYVDTKAPTVPELSHIYEIWGSHSYSSSWVHHYSSDVGINGTWITNGSDPYLAFFNISYLGNVNGAYVELTDALTRDIYVQVFYSTSSIFTESNSKTVLLKAGETKVVLPFRSNGNYVNFRFDIGSVSGLRYKIKSLGLISSERDWWKDYRNIQSTSSDDGSGIDKWFWKDNQKTAWQEAGTSRVSSDKSEYISVWKAEFDRKVKFKVCDKAGNCTESSEHSAGVDTIAPNPPTTMEFVYGDWSRYTQGSWINRDVYAGSTSSSPGPSGATDSLSGISHYEYKHSDEIGWETYNYVYTNYESGYHMIGEGTHYRYFRAVDNAGNVSSYITRTAKIDKTPPRIWQSSWNNSECLAYYKNAGTCTSNATKCLEIGYDDNYTPSNEIKVAYSICIEGYSTGKTYDVKCVDGFTAYDRLNYYVNNGTCKGPADLYNNNCYKTWAEKAIHVYYYDGNSYAGLCTSYGDRTTQYAYRACDLAGNCSAIGTSSR